MTDSTRWKINALIGALENTHSKLGMRDCQLRAWTDGVWQYEGDATEAFEILNRIERQLKASGVKGGNDDASDGS